MGYFGSICNIFKCSLDFCMVFLSREQKEHNQPVAISNYFNMTFRDTMENWQSEFLQLIWQVAGLSFLWYIGSPQSKEGDERKEEKMDLIIKMLDPKNAKIILKELETKYPKK
jgi:hypothetical protein